MKEKIEQLLNEYEYLFPVIKVNDIKTEITIRNGYKPILFVISKHGVRVKSSDNDTYLDRHVIAIIYKVVGIYNGI